VPAPFGTGGSGGSDGSGGVGGADNSGGVVDASDLPACFKDDGCPAGQTCSGGRCIAKACPPARTHFSVKADAAATVNLAGTFNAWSTSATPLARDAGTGVWGVDLDLQLGQWLYKFVLTDAAGSAANLTWIADPRNPLTEDDGFGGQNSVIQVTCESVAPPDGGSQ